MLTLTCLKKKLSFPIHNQYNELLYYLNYDLCYEEKNQEKKDNKNKDKIALLRQILDSVPILSNLKYFFFMVFFLNIK